MEYAPQAGAASFHSAASRTQADFDGWARLVQRVHGYLRAAGGAGGERAEERVLKW
jgi:hypothetical protein